MSAPARPAYGAACNGCGVCCQAELCPLAIVRYWRRRGPCPALDRRDGRFVCGLMDRPGWLPRWLVARWIAAGKGCDSADEG